MIKLRLALVGVLVVGLLSDAATFGHAAEMIRVGSFDMSTSPFTPASKSRIKRNYQDHAGERDGLCRRPYIDAITRIDIVEDTATGLVVDLRYSFRDRIRDDDDGHGRGCFGFESRRFTLKSVDGNIEVVAMSGTPCKGLVISLDRILGLGDDRRRRCQ